jgi:hypothetical protein
LYYLYKRIGLIPWQKPGAKCSGLCICLNSLAGKILPVPILAQNAAGAEEAEASAVVPEDVEANSAGAASVTDAGGKSSKEG